MAEPGAKTGVTRTFASAGTPVTVTDPCLATAAEAASRSVSVILAPSATISTVAKAVVAWSSDETGAPASFIASGTGVGGDSARDTAREPDRDASGEAGHIAATKDALGAGSPSGVP